MKSFRRKPDRHGQPTEWSPEEALRTRVDRLQTTIDNLLEGFQVIDRNWRYVYLNEAAAQHGRTTINHLLYRTMMECYPGIEDTEMFSALKRCMVERVNARLENKFSYPDGRSGWFELSVEPVPEGICVLSVDITERRQAEAQLDRRLSELEAVNRVSTALREAQGLEEMLPLLLNETLSVLRYPQGAIWLYDPITNELCPKVTLGYGEDRGVPTPPPEKPGEGIAGRTLVSGQPEISNDLRADERLPESYRQRILPGTIAAAVAIRTSEGVVGAFMVGDRGPRMFSEFELDLLTTLSEIAGNAIHRMRLHDQTVRRLSHLAALREIDLAITTSFDLRRNLRTVLEHVTSQLGVDAADVLLLNKRSGLLEFAAGRGFRNSEIERSSLHLGEGTAGSSALENKLVYLADLREDHSFVRSALVNGEGFVAYYCTPLTARGQVRGVIEVFHRGPLEKDQEWIDFFNALAGQTAIAVEVSSLFDSLQRSANDVTLAYDATIEGWSRALDLRDKETEGHTQRVTDLTVRLARAYGMSDDELVQIRWGGLLHDIGKMGVPDAILLKPGPLTDEEWVSMKRHPTFAFEMLSPIRYLRNALDIPYCHHEKWDGTGYPRGLKGEQIPIAARLFAVVDVWDALRSDRPYRPGWSEEKVRDHIKGLSGTHFDPEAVRLFMQVTESGRAAERS